MNKTDRNSMLWSIIKNPLKKAFFYFSVALYCLQVTSIQCQEYMALPDSIAVWIVGNSSSAGDFYYEYSIDSYPNDTIIDSTRYTKIYITDASDYNFYAGAFRSDSSGKAFFVPPYVGYTDEHLWYDFSLSTGDTVRDIALNDMQPGLVGEYDFKVDSTRILSVGPYGLKCLHLSPIPPYPPFYTHNSLVWVEGIGSLNGGIYNMYMCGISASSLTCMSKNDTIFYYTNSIDCEVFEEQEFIYSPGICKVPVSVQDLGNLKNKEAKIASISEGEVTISNLPSDCINIHIYNQLGSLVELWKIEPSCQLTQKKFSGLSAGIHIVVLETHSEILTQKVFVK